MHQPQFDQSNVSGLVNSMTYVCTSYKFKTCIYGYTYRSHHHQFIIDRYIMMIIITISLALSPPIHVAVAVMWVIRLYKAGKQHLELLSVGSSMLPF